MAACSIHACIVGTGHVWGFDPYGIPILRPTPSWSTFDRRNVTVRPSLPKTQSSTSSPTSSDRRNAPDHGAHLEREVAAIGHVEHVVEEAVLFVPHTMAIVAHVVDGVGDVEEVFPELAGHIFVGGVSARELE